MLGTPAELAIVRRAAPNANIEMSKLASKHPRSYHTSVTAGNGRPVHPSAKFQIDCRSDQGQIESRSTRPRFLGFLAAIRLVSPAPANPSPLPLPSEGRLHVDLRST